MTISSPCDSAYTNQLEVEKHNQLNDQILNATSSNTPTLSAPGATANGKKNFNYKSLTMTIFKNKKQEASIQPSPLFMTHPTRKIPVVNSPNNQTPTKFQTRKNLVETVFANKETKSATHSIMSPLMVQIPLRTPTAANTAKQVLTMDTPAVIDKAAQEQKPSIFASFKETFGTVMTNFKNSRQVKAVTSVTMENFKNSFNLFTLIMTLLVITAIVNCFIGMDNNSRMTAEIRAIVLTSVSCAFLLNFVAQLYRSTKIMALFASWNLGGLGYMAYLFYLSIIGDPRWFEHVGGIHVGFLLLFLSQVESIVFTVQYYRQNKAEEAVDAVAPQPETTSETIVVQKGTPPTPLSATSCASDQSGPALSVRDSLRSQTNSPYVVMRSE